MSIENEYVLPLKPLDTVQSKQWPQFLAVLSASWLALGSGFQIGWTSPSIPKMLSNDMGFEITKEQVSYIVLIPSLGYVIGSPLSGFFLDKIGRKYTLLLLAVPQIVQWLLIATSTDIAFLYIARFATGIADGALFTTLPIYVGEITEPKVRGALGMYHSIGICTGFLLFNAYGSYVSIKAAAYISLTAPVMFLLTFVWMPDSPYYLIMKGKITKARKSLQTLRRMTNVDLELNRIMVDVRRQVSEPGRFKDIFTIKTNRKGFFIIGILRTFQQLSGLTSLSYYTQVIFQDVGGGLSPAVSAIICSAVQVVVMVFCCKFIDKFGRKPLIIFSSISTALALTVIGLFFCFQGLEYDVSNFMWLPLTFMVLYFIVCAVGLLIVPNIMAGELLSVSVKSKALGLLNCYFGICVASCLKLFQVLDDSFGMGTPFFAFAFFCVLSSIFCYFKVPETKGKTLEEIQQILNEKNKRPSHITVIEEKEFLQG